MKSFLIAVFLLLTVMPALASDYQADFIPLVSTILANESASFKVAINNFESRSLRFQLYTLDTDWVISSEPTVASVPAQSRAEYLLQVRPKTNVGYGTQGMTVLLKNLDESIIQKENLIIHVTDPNAPARGYVASVQLDVSVPEEINPREPLRIGIGMRNRNNLNISSMDVRIFSTILDRTYETSLGPIMEKREEIVFNLDPYLPPASHELRVSLTYNDKRVSEYVTTFDVKAVEEVAETPKDETGPLLVRTTLLLENTGNTQSVYLATIPTTRLKALFTNTNPKTGTRVIGGLRYHAWELTLSPQETAVVVATQNYRLPVALLVLALAGVLLYYVMRSPLIAVKETILLRDNDETSSQLKIRLFIKNRTGHVLQNVSVIDRVPSIATYMRKETLGVISPTKVITSPKKGTVLKWELDVLEPYEERILSYNLSSRLKIVGRLKLPAAKVHFASRGGKERVTYTKSMTLDE